uniref:Uncharacterized protein n=1 Tax=Fagus sylvatica TaxID=28930 RepID=A0A2N9I006_FAGSY
MKMETGGGTRRWCLTRWAFGVAFGDDTGSDDGGSSGNFSVWWVVNGWVHGGCWVVAVWGCGVADLKVVREAGTKLGSDTKLMQDNNG